MKDIILLSALIGLVICQNGIPTDDESLEELVNSGVSEKGAAGIVKFDLKFQKPFELEKTDPVAAKKEIDVLHNEFNEYVESMSASDQEAYQRYIKNKHSQ